jgi:tetratricopeptide (TPR) repeat protein
MAVDLASLFTRLEQLAPQFGRAEADLLTLVARGRSGDSMGAVQSARAVVETVLRHLVTAELGQAPGEARLDALLGKFQQSANAGVIPGPVLAHLGTVQAASPGDQAKKPSPEEVGATLDALVAVLSWYAGKYGPAPVSAGSAAPRKKTNPLVMALALVIPIGGGLYFAWIIATQGPNAVEVANAGVALNKFYLANREPPPGGHCRVSDTRTLVAISHSPGSLALLREVKVKHPEVSYLLARALAESKQPLGSHLDEALACEGFAAAHGLKAKLLAKEGKADEAVAELKKALATEPDWASARFDLALLELERGRVKEAAEHLKAYVELAPGDGDGWLRLGAAYETLGVEPAKAKEAFCQAEKRGKAEAKARCTGP